MITSVEIQGLRGIREGKVEGLTPLTVLVGPNGAGKSTVLEALLIGASPAQSPALEEAVRRHDGIEHGALWLFWRGGHTPSARIRVCLEDGAGKETTLNLIQPVNETRPTIVRNITSFGRHGGGTRSSVTQFEAGNSVSGENDRDPLNGITNVQLVEPAAFKSGRPLHQVYTAAVKTARKQDMQQIIADIVPEFEAIEVLTEGDKPLLHVNYKNRSVPAALVGDGIRSLLRLGMELAAGVGGLVLLEEPELHQHPRAIAKTAKAIWAAVARGVQVVLTTHSLDLIDNLLAAAPAEHFEKLSLQRLSLADGILRSVVRSAKEIAFSRGDIENDLR